MMKAIITPELQEVMDAEQSLPAVSIIMPFDTKMCLKAELAHSLKIAAGKVGQELLEDYPRELALLTMDKLNVIIKDLNYNSHKKSIAIYVSPVFEKVLYLDIIVEEKIALGESFEIRDLVYSKKRLHKYLVLLLSSTISRIYLANAENFVRIVSNTPEAVQVNTGNMPEREANFSGMSGRKEVMLDKFLHHIDIGLDIILNAYRLPLFVLGTERLLGHFKKVSKHTGAVIEYVKGDYEEATLRELKQLLDPYTADWKKVIQKDLLNQLEEASGKKTLAMGMKDVWQEAMVHKGRLLVVEKNYMYAALHGSGQEVFKTNEPYNKFSYIRDAVDDIIAKVLEVGGDVEFVDKDVLKSYDHIALVKYY